MKVLVITNLFPLPWDSTLGLFNAQQISQLAQHHEVTVVVPVPWRQWWRHRARCHPHDYGNIRVVPVLYLYLPGLFRASYALTLFLSLWVQRRRFSEPRADVMLATWLYPDAVAAGWLARCWRLPLLMKAHGSDVNVQCQFSWRRRQVVAASRHASRLITVSQDLSRQLAAMGVAGDKLETLYNGIDTQRFYPSDRAEMRARLGVTGQGAVLLYVGNLKVSKGVLDLVEALQQLPASLWQQCILLGDGPDRKLLETHPGMAALSGKVRLLGRLPHDDIRSWMVAADLLLLPSHAEGVPNVVLEAMACGLPVVASRLPGIEEVVPHYAGVLSTPRSPKDTANAIATALQQDWRRADIIAHAGTFSWQRNRDRLVALLEQARSDGVAHD
jgi:glycosyltransferase involved in cell wall biosynthesis